MYTSGCFGMPINEVLGSLVFGVVRAVLFEELLLAQPQLPVHL